MLKKVIALSFISFLLITRVHALERPDKEFKIFQFPSNMIPRIDGNKDDWDIVPEDYGIGTEELVDTMKGKAPTSTVTISM